MEPKSLISQVSGARNGVSVMGQDHLVGEGMPQPSFRMNKCKLRAATDGDDSSYLLSTSYVPGTLLSTRPGLPFKRERDCRHGHSHHMFTGKAFEVWTPREK